MIPLDQFINNLIELKTNYTIYLRQCQPHQSMSPFRDLANRSYKKIINTCDVLLQAKPRDMELLLKIFHVSIGNLTRNPVLDTYNDNCSFLLYDSLLEDFKNVILPTDPHKYSGWDCEISPDNHCHYYSYNFTVGEGIKLNNDEIVLIRDLKAKKLIDGKWNMMNATSDCCMFCSSPQERK